MFAKGTVVATSIVHPPFVMLNFLAQIPLNAERLPATESAGWIGQVFTNSLIVAALVAIIVLVFARRATRTMELVPNRGSQNIFEAVIEALYDMLEGIVGPHMVPKAFPLLATLFLFILISNWFGLLPGVGSIGFTPAAQGRGPLLSLQEVQNPLLRPANADLNLTLGMALVFTVFWTIWSFQELGVGGFFSHIFGPKGDVQGWMKYPLLLIFAFVGVIEVISIAFRPVSLSLRLFGNIYAGENLMHTMSSLGETMGMHPFLSYFMKVIIPIPFYFLELLVGVVQALVFTLLCAVYLKLTTSHEDGAHGHSHGAEEHAPRYTLDAERAPEAVPTGAH